MSVEEGSSGSFCVVVGPELPECILKSTKFKKLRFI